MKIYNVSFNDGGWHESMPRCQVVANTKEEAIELGILKTGNTRQFYDIWASEFKIEGYIIEVYDEKSYKRDKKLEVLEN